MTNNRPTRTPVRPPPCRCSDPDDQKFIDLALHAGARWLLSHDKAVLRLAAPARRLGLQILPPARWSMAGPGEAK